MSRRPLKSWLLFGVLLILSGILILQTTGVAVFDQASLVDFSFAKSIYPCFVNGTGSSLIVGIYRALISPTPEQVHVHVRLLALVLFALSSMLLATRVLKSEIMIAAFALILFTSRIPFLWLSKELFAASILCFFFYFSLGGKVLLAALFLGFWSTMKVEMVFGSLFVLGFYLWMLKNRAQQLRVLGGYALVLLLVHGTGLLLLGSPYFTTDGGRSDAVFYTHYADLFLKHQLMDRVPDPAMNFPLWHDRMFPEARSFLDVLVKYPSHYLDFLAMAVLRTFKRLGVVLNFLLLLLPLRIWLLKDNKKAIHPFELLMWVSFISLLPAQLMGFVHARYFARHFPVALLLLLFVVQWLQDQAKSSSHQRLLRVSYSLTFASIAWNTLVLGRDLMQMGSMTSYWFSD